MQEWLAQGASPLDLTRETHSALAAIGLLAAYVITRHRFVGRRAFEFLTMVSFAIPGTVIGVSYIVALHVAPLELTGGSSLLNGMYYFRGDVPLREFAAAQGTIVGLGVRAFGRRILPELPFEEAFFLPFARQFRRELDMPLILLGGINERATIDGALAEGFEFVAMARALLREPDLVNRMATSANAMGLCVHCNKCMPTIYRGTHCVLVPEGERA